MNSTENNSMVAKFGGSSMVYPEIVAEQLAYEENDAGAIIVSAPGKDADNSIKVTEMLLDYAARPSTHKKISIQARYADIASRLGSHDVLDRVVESIPEELDAWQEAGAPVEALGERWSARLFAAYTGRTYIDASRLIRFAADGQLNSAATTANVQRELNPRGRYVIPGFYGADNSGKVHVFERGGSDITGALVARALGSEQYHNWSDVAGFMSADPRRVPGARLLPEINYREARELANGGSQLLHRTVIKILGSTTTETHMRNTFGGPKDDGTRVTARRSDPDQLVIGVTGRNDMSELSVHEFGLNEAVGSTTDIYTFLAGLGVPYEHSATATDDVSVFFEGKYAPVVAVAIDHLRTPSRHVTQRPIGMVHIVGEGLASSGINRSRILGKVMLAFAENNIASHGITDVGGSASMTVFVSPELQETTRAIQVVHEAILSD